MNTEINLRPKAYSYLRMSTDLQLRGDSRRRQLELSQQYAATHNLQLVDGGQLEDIGVSAFKGANLKQGALGQFLDAVRQKKIPEGSYLLVESLDRLNRQQIMTSFSTFSEIINYGITVVTLNDERVYNQNTGLSDLIWSLVVFSRANEESETKSKRLRSVWAHKRRTASEKKLTSVGPGWLVFDAEKNDFQVDQQKALIVRGIFSDSATGLGVYTITQRLNRRKIPTFGRSRVWHSSYVTKILNNRAAIGEFQPHRILMGKRLPDGEAIKKYFPVVVDEELFLRAQHARYERRTSGGGRKGKLVSNLFSKIAVCAYCGSAVRYINKGAGPKGGRYLRCSSAINKLGCESSGWKYEDFEKAFLSFVREVDVSAIVNDRRNDRRKTTLQELANSRKGKLVTLIADREKVMDLLLRVGGSQDYVALKLDEIEDQIKLTKKELSSIEDHIEKAYVQASNHSSAKEKLHELISQSQDSDYDLQKIRAHIAKQISELVQAIEIAPEGTSLVSLRATEKLVTVGFDEHDFDPSLAGRPYFTALFREAESRTVYLSKDDSHQFEQIINRWPGQKTIKYKDGHELHHDYKWDQIGYVKTGWFDGGEELLAIVTRREASEQYPNKEWFEFERDLKAENEEIERYEAGEE